MSTQDNHKLPPSSDADEPNDVPNVADDASEDTSEVAMRLNLLGKLIIPPTNPDIPRV